MCSAVLDRHYFSSSLSVVFYVSARTYEFSKTAVCSSVMHQRAAAFGGSI